MNPKWADIDKALSEQRIDRRMADSDGFWEDFRAHAKLRSQESAVSAPSGTYAWRWGLASACAVLVVMVAGLRILPGIGEETTGTIKSIDVTAAHSAVMILDDENSESTILWIVEMDTDDENGDST